MPSYVQTMQDLERLLSAAAVDRKSEEVARLRDLLESELISYKATRALRRTLEEGRQEMTLRLQDKLRRLRARGRRLKTALLEQHEERNPELLLYEAAPVVTMERVKGPARKPAARRARRSQRPAGSGECCRHCCRHQAAKK